jgi:hypothetical protein
VFIQKLRPQILSQVKIIKKLIEDKVDKMARSEKKRITGKKPVSKKSQVKFEKRLKNNHEILSRLK